MNKEQLNCFFLLVYILLFSNWFGYLFLWTSGSGGVSYTICILISETSCSWSGSGSIYYYYHALLTSLWLHGVPLAVNEYIVGVQNKFRNRKISKCVTLSRKTWLKIIAIVIIVIIVVVVIIITTTVIIIAKSYKISKNRISHFSQSI